MKKYLVFTLLSLKIALISFDLYGMNANNICNARAIRYVTASDLNNLDGRNRFHERIDEIIYALPSTSFGALYEEILRELDYFETDSAETQNELIDKINRIFLPGIGVEFALWGRCQRENPDKDTALKSWNQYMKITPI